MTTTTSASLVGVTFGREYSRVASSSLKSSFGAAGMRRDASFVGRRNPSSSDGKREKRRAGAVGATRAGTDFLHELGVKLRNEEEKKMPPGRVGLFGVRETLEYLMDSNKFVETRVEKYGPIFKTAFFFKPTIAFGSKEAVEEFKSFEASLPADEALPETFRELHTEYGALKQSGAKHKATRKNFARVLGREALETYVPELVMRTEEFVNKLEQRKVLFPGKDIKRFALKTLFYLFLGKVPEDDILEEMYLYNAGLLSLGKFDPTFKKGESALEKLTQYVLAYYLEVKKDDAKLNAPEHFFLKQYSEATDEFGEIFSDERIATTIVLMVWGSYIEAAALIGHSIRILGEKRNADVLKKAKEEALALRKEEEEQTLSTLAQKGKYLLAVSKETLRFHPQTAGGLRVNPMDRKFCGYNIPAGYVLTADPRIAFLDETAFSDPKAFNPSRFLEASKSEDRFFPGGMGQHQCPGINLATTMNVIFLTKFLTTFSSWKPSEGMPEKVPLVQVPIVIIDDSYRLDLMR